MPAASRQQLRVLAYIARGHGPLLQTLIVGSDPPNPRITHV
jgi:hypothetical protein